MKIIFLIFVFSVYALAAEVDVEFDIRPLEEPLPWRIHLHGLEFPYYQNSVSVTCENESKGISTGLFSHRFEDVPPGRYLLYYQVGLGNYVKALDIELEGPGLKHFNLKGFSVYPRIRINFESIPFADPDDNMNFRYSCYRKSDTSDLWYEVSFYPSMRIVRDAVGRYYTVLNNARPGGYLFIVKRGDARMSYEFKLSQTQINTLSVDSIDLGDWEKFEPSKYEIFKLKELLKNSYPNHDSFDPFKNDSK